jgi:hypothetical protein
MCLACEGVVFLYRDYAASFLARGEMPPGFTAADLQALGFVPPFPSSDASEAPRRGTGEGAATIDAFRCEAAGDE